MRLKVNQTVNQSRSWQRSLGREKGRIEPKKQWQRVDSNKRIMKVKKNLSKCVTILIYFRYINRYYNSFNPKGYI